MIDVFEKVKGVVDIVLYVENDTGSRAKKEGTTYRINPCPLCYHNDCFTLYPSDNSFNCFSGECGKGGSVVDYEMFRQNITDPLEAARSIAKKESISLEESGFPQASKSQTSGNERKEPGSEPKIDEERALALRGIVADFYHEQLLDNKKALEYQINIRGHSLEILKVFKIGYVGRWSLIKLAKECGYSVEDLVDVGLIKKLKNGYVPYIPEKFYIYPHFLNGKVLFFSIKDPTKDKKFQIRKRYASTGWLAFNQDVLDGSGPIVLTEGEDDLLSIVDRAKQSDTVCILGNFNTPAILAFLKKNSSEKTFYFAFDRDPAGKKYVEKYAQGILAGGGRVFEIEIPEPHEDIDNFLRASWDPKHDFNKLVKEARGIEKDHISRHDLSQTQDDKRELLVYQFTSFKVLGELADRSIAFDSIVKRKTYIIHPKDLNLDALDQIGHEEVRNKVVRSEKQLEDGKVHFFALKRDIIIEAGKRLLGEEKWLGQGGNLLEDGRLLIVNGDQISLWNGDQFKRYDNPIIEKKFIRRNPAYEWIDLELVEKTVSQMTKDKAAEIFQDLLQRIQQWHFVSDYDEILVAGFLLAQRIQALWDWRPHMWIDGPAGSGKTCLLEFGNKISNKLSKLYEGQSLSEAGFRQNIQYGFIMNFIDEFEKSNARYEIINLLRSAGRGGTSTKGTSSGKAVHYEIRHMVMIASIERSLARAAERDRFITIEMKKDPDRDPRPLNVKEAEQLKVNLFSFALWASFKAKEIIEKIGRIGNYERRLAEAYAVPLAMVSVIDPEPLESLQTHTRLILDDRKDYGEGEIPDDEVRVLDDIFSSTIRVAMSDEGESRTVYVDRSILWLLNSTSEYHQEDAAAHGIWKTKDGGIFFACDLITRKLLKDTLWKDMNITSILKRFQGAERTRIKKDGKFFRGVKFDDTTRLFDKKLEHNKRKQEDLFNE